jgi:hypothetical protein
MPTPPASGGVTTEWLKAKLAGKSTEYDTAIAEGHYMLHGTRLVNELATYKPDAVFKIQTLLWPNLKENFEVPLITLESTIGWQGRVLMPNKLDPTGLKYWNINTVKQKYQERLELLTKGPNLEAFSKIVNYTMWCTLCLGCTRREGFSALQYHGTVEYPRMYFLQAEIPEILAWMAERTKWPPIWSGLAAYCQKCRVKCGGCGKMLPRLLNREWLASLLADSVCTACGGHRLSNVVAPKPDRKMLGVISRKFIIG